MFAKFPLFQSHLDLAHQYWNSIVAPGDTVIDATCGNGHDTLALAKLALMEDAGTLLAIDIQPQAIEITRELLRDKLPSLHGRISYLQRCHSSFPEELSPGTVKLIVYNLGYLPGGNKRMTTSSETTLRSLAAALALVSSGGAISITCYPGHSEGEIEETLILKWAESLDPCQWSACHHRWFNRKKAPSLLLLQRMKDEG